MVAAVYGVDCRGSKASGCFDANADGCGDVDDGGGDGDVSSEDASDKNCDGIDDDGGGGGDAGTEDANANGGDDVDDDKEPRRSELAFAISSVPPVPPRPSIYRWSAH